jgi:hypothetical protein
VRGPFRTTPVDTAGMDADGALELLQEILADLPRFPGAACIGRHDLYDPVSGGKDPSTTSKSGNGGRSRGLWMRTGVASTGPRARSHRLPDRAPRCHRPDRSDTRLVELGKRARRSQRNRNSGATFGKITGSGQNGHLSYRVAGSG